MPTIHVPEPFRPTLERIASMSDADVQKVSDLLAGLDAQVKPENLMKSAVGKSDVPGVDEIVQTLIGLSLTRVRFDAPLDQFVRDISRTIKKDVGVLQERLKVLLDADVLLRSARAFDVQHEHEKIFRSARIISDVRPIFNSTGTEATGAMIIHNLNIAFVHNGEAQEIIFALDDADVAALKKVLDRADAKSTTLEAIISKTGVPYLASKDSDD